MTSSDNSPSDDRSSQTDPIILDLDETHPLSVALATALESLPTTPATPHDPLYEHIDPDALDALFTDTCDGISRSAGSVSFEYGTYWVTVRSDYTAELKPHSHESGADE